MANIRGPLLVIALTMGAPTARADTTVPRAGVGWVPACEAQLRAAADEWDRGLDFPTLDLFRHWAWQVGDDHVELHYTQGRANEDYTLRIASGRGLQSLPWRASVTRGARSPDRGEQWWLKRTVRGRLATFRAGAGAGRPRVDAFWARFRPAVDACLTQGVP